MGKATDTGRPAFVIYGGTGGIGSATARLLSSRGSDLVIVARDTARLDALAGDLDCRTISADVTQMEGAVRGVEASMESFGRLDGVVNCLGSILLKPAHLTSDEEWQETLTINLTSAFHVVRAAVKTMPRGKAGSIVLLSTAAARRGLPNHEAIAAAKAGVIGLTMSSAATYAPRGIRVNCVAPGLVRTPLSRAITDNEMALKYSTQLHALGRIGEPEDVAECIAWLLNPGQAWITGQVFGVDGGLSTVQSKAV
jgi:NAD(P)-dependent dehydrogenase (short-subunit alcohol dehydrogenase family)